MRVDLLTREYPPFIYGGAGVHVHELSQVMRELVDLRIHAFDGPRVPDTSGAGPGVQGYTDIPELADANPAVQALGVDLAMTPDIAGTDLVHSHTWYTNFAGYLAKLLYGVPLVISAHSLEPLRPWKAEQLGGGYRVSSFVEKLSYENADAIIAVSHGMKHDILRAYPTVDPGRVHVIHNGVDLDRWRRPETEKERDAARSVQEQYGVDPDKQTVMFVGRVTRQKGLPHLLRAVKELPPEVQVVLCAGSPDTKEIGEEVDSLVEELQRERSGVVHIPQSLEQNEIIALLGAADVFATPSLYEPLGIVNLEAMAMGLPVVGTATGGIPDVIVDGVTGYLVPIEQVQDGTGRPIDPEKFEADFAASLNRVLADPVAAKRMGEAGLARAREHFSWKNIGKDTVELYRSLVALEDEDE